MKSLLVDALRQANSDESDQVLSDSGSFDTTSRDFGAIANDEHGSDAGELELMSTSRSLVLPTESANDLVDDAEGSEFPGDSADEQSPDAPANDSVQPSESETNLYLTGIAVVQVPVKMQHIPRLASFAPLLCVALAAVVAGSWLLYQQMGTGRSGASLGALTAQSLGADRAHNVEAAQAVHPDERFPFQKDPQAAGERTTQ